MNLNIAFVYKKTPQGTFKLRRIHVISGREMKICVWMFESNVVLLCLRDAAGAVPAAVGISG